MLGASIDITKLFMPGDPDAPKNLSSEQIGAD